MAAELVTPEVAVAGPADTSVVDGTQSPVPDRGLEAAADRAPRPTVGADAMMPNWRVHTSTGTADKKEMMLFLHPRDI